MKKLKEMIKVNWNKEGLTGNNKGYIHGIYFVIANALSRSSRKRYGLIYFSHDICDTKCGCNELDNEMWYKTKKERDKQFQLYKGL